MSYFDYHAKIKKMIRNGELKYYYFDKQYKNIGYALVLCFEKKIYPIREEKFFEYFELIGEYYQIEKNNDINLTVPKSNQKKL